MLPRGPLMIRACLKSLANALSNVASVRAPLTIAKDSTWRSFERHRPPAPRRASSRCSEFASADLSLPARSNCVRNRRTLSSRANSALSSPSATKRGFPLFPRSQSVIALLWVRNAPAAFASTIRHTVRYPEGCVLHPRRTGGSPLAGC